MADVDRKNYQFEMTTTENFEYLQKFGFVISNSLPTIVSYSKGDVVVNIFHGRSSYEVGLEACLDGVGYSISEIIRLSDPTAAAEFRNSTATSPESISTSIAQMADLMRRYGVKVLDGDRATFEALAKLRQDWSRQYELEVRAGQIRPQADEAFRSKNYSAAALLYESIKPLLTPAEMAKLELAAHRAKK